VTLNLPKTWLNGRTATSVSVYDRGLMYGQSLFETIAVVNYQPKLLEQHLRRLQHGAEALGIPCNLPLLEQEINNVCRTDSKFPESAVLRLSLTMGEGGRGYSNPKEVQSNRIITLYNYPVYPDEYWVTGINLGLSEVRLAQQPLLAGFKHSNRLEQTIARAKWHEGWQEAILLDTDSQVIEGTQSNLFIVSNNKLRTPDLKKAGVAGVMRDFILQQTLALGVDCEVQSLTIKDIETADEVFMTNSVIGLWPVRQFAKRRYNQDLISQKILTCIRNHELISNH